MARKALNILILTDLSLPPPPDQNFTSLLELEEWDGEKRLVKTLQNLGHQVRVFGIHDKIEPFLQEIEKSKPDLVFNQCEAIRRDRRQEPNIAALLSLLGIRYTGCGPASLQLCKDKGLTKKILAFHDVRVPQFQISRINQPLKVLREFPYPAFIKPLSLDASEGIAQISFCENEKDTLERVRFIHQSLGADAIVEEFISGREISIGVMGLKKMRLLPPMELFFRQVPASEPKFATYKAKWDESYRKRWGIKSGPARNLAPQTLKQMNDACLEIVQLFDIKGYARIDFRVTETGEPVFIEANPNPSLHWDDDFAISADKAGIGYPELIEEIVELGLG